MTAKEQRLRILELVGTLAFAASGAITGSHGTGGIAGTNSGTILNCTSRSSGISSGSDA